MQKTLSFKIIQTLAVVAGVIGLASLAGCGNSGGASAGGSVTPTINASTITIDNAGVIPVFGNSSTATVVYVHNNGKSAVSGISYSAVANSSKANNSLSSKLLGLLKSNKSLATIDGSQCATIAAGQSCPLAIVTPVLTDSSSQGSMQIKASYSLNNKPTTFSQLISYAKVQNNIQTAGAKFQAGIDISGYGNQTGYATIYLYGSGQNQVYNVSSMTINKPAVTIVNGDISGRQIQSNFVQAVEVSSPILSSSISATITVNSGSLQSNSVQANKSVKSSNKSLNASKSLLTADQFSSSVDLAVEPVSAGAILTTGLVPLINTVSTTSGSLLIQNSGNQDAVVGGVSADAGISSLSGCTGETLAPAAVCTINFNVTESGGSGNISVPYTGGSASSVAANVTWFNGIGAALVSMSASNNPLTFSATVGGSTTVTVQNIGGYTLSNISIPTPVVVSGSATATLANNNCAESVTLPIGLSCSYDVSVADSATDLNQQINLGFSASYAGHSGTQAYSRVLPLTYSSTAYGAIIAITPADAMTISGNNFESTTQILTISNSGNLPANISSVLSDNPAYLTESATTCGATLAAAASCTSTLQFGPTYSAAGASGASNYTVDYTAVGQTPSGSVVSSIDWTVQSYAQSISLTSVESSGAASGDGLSGTPYIFSGSSNANKLVTLTYTNTGTSSLKITGIQESNSVYAWSMPGDDNTCDNNVTLQPNATCSIQFENVLATNILALGASVGATYTENINVPTLTYQDATNSQVQFNAQPNLPTGGTIIYAQSNQATLSNSVTVNQIGTAYESVTVSHLIANATDYSNFPLKVTTQMEDYYVAGAPYSTTNDCSLSHGDDGVLTQTCYMTNDPSNYQGITYMVNQTLLNADTNLNLTALFSSGVSQQGGILSMNPIFATANLGMTPIYAYIADGGTVAGGITQCNTNPTTGVLTNCTLAIDGGFSRPRQIVAYNGFMYIGSATGNLQQCAIGGGGVVSTCSVAESSLTGISGIAFNNGFAYVTANDGTGTSVIKQCSVANPAGTLSNCVEVKRFHEGTSYYGMTVNNSYLYVTLNDEGDSMVVKSTINPSNGSLSGWASYTPTYPNTGDPLLDNPSAIAINNGFAYVTSNGTGSVVQCSVNGSSGALTNCATLDPSFNSPYGISISYGFAYIANNGNNTISSCAINSSTGALSGCSTSGSNFNGPYGITTN